MFRNWEKKEKVKWEKIIARQTDKVSNRSDVHQWSIIQKKRIFTKRVTLTNISKLHADRRMVDINPYIHKATQIQWERGGRGLQQLRMSTTPAICKKDDFLDFANHSSPAIQLFHVKHLDWYYINIKSLSIMS